MEDHKTFFSDKGLGKSDITLIEGDEICQEDAEVAKILNEFFNNAVTSLNIAIPDEYKSEESAVSNDPIEKILSKFVNHPSIKMINDNVEKGNFCFSALTVADVEKEIKALDSKKASMSSSIPANILKETVIFSPIP